MLQIIMCTFVFFKYSYILFVKLLRYLSRILGYHATEDDLCKAVIDMSDDCPKRYLDLVIVLYTAVYVGCDECRKECDEIFNALRLPWVRGANNHVSLSKISHVLKQFSSPPNQLPLTRQLLKCLQGRNIDTTKEYEEDLMRYIKCWLMALSIYCPCQQPLTVDNAQHKKMNMKKSVSIKCESQHFNSNSVSVVSKSIKSSQANDQNIVWVLDHLFYPTSLLYALRILPYRRLINNHRLEDLTTLTIHVVSSSLLLETKHWEVFMDELPKMNRLNVVFIIQDEVFKKSLKESNWEVNNRIITYSVQHMQYHMYFSSDEYFEPDVVVVYGNSYEMSTNGNNNVHSEISYCNMTHDPDTVLVLMDSTEELVKQGVRDVNAARPVNQLTLPQVNRIRGYGSKKAELNYETNEILIDNNYFSCLSGK